MIRRAAKIPLVDEADWGNPFATIATIDYGIVRLGRNLAARHVVSWRDSDDREPFKVLPEPRGACVQ